MTATEEKKIMNRRLDVVYGELLFLSTRELSASFLSHHQCRHRIVALFHESINRSRACSEV